MKYDRIYLFLVSESEAYHINRPHIPGRCFPSLPGFGETGEKPTREKLMPVFLDMGVSKTYRGLKS